VRHELKLPKQAGMNSCQFLGVKTKQQQRHLDIPDIRCISELHTRRVKSLVLRDMSLGYASHRRDDETALVTVFLRQIRLEACSLSMNNRKRCAKFAGFLPLPIVQLCPCLSQVPSAPQKKDRGRALSFWSKIAQYGCRKRD
jgi:hypothetical protein